MNALTTTIVQQLNVAQHLNVAADAIIKVEEWATVLWVKFVGGCRFVSKQVIKMTTPIKYDIFNGRHFVAEVLANSKEEAILNAANLKRSQSINPDSVMGKWTAKVFCDRFISWEEAAYQDLEPTFFAKENGIEEHVQSVTHGWNVSPIFLDLVQSKLNIAVSPSTIEYAVI